MARTRRGKFFQVTGERRGRVASFVVGSRAERPKQTVTSSAKRSGFRITSLKEISRGEARSRTVRALKRGEDLFVTRSRRTGSIITRGPTRRRR